MFTLVFLDMELISAVPLPPQPIKPKRIAGFVPEAKTASGLKIVTADNEAALFMKFLLSILFFNLLLEYTECYVNNQMVLGIRSQEPGAKNQDNEY